MIDTWAVVTLHLHPSIKLTLDYAAVFGSLLITSSARQGNTARRDRISKSKRNAWEHVPKVGNSNSLAGATDVLLSEGQAPSGMVGLVPQFSSSPLVSVSQNGACQVPTPVPAQQPSPASAERKRVLTLTLGPLPSWYRASSVDQVRRGQMVTQLLLGSTL